MDLWGWVRVEEEGSFQAMDGRAYRGSDGRRGMFLKFAGGAVAVAIFVLSPLRDSLTGLRD